MSDDERVLTITGLLTGEDDGNFALFCSVEALLDRLERVGLEDMP
ncbi:MAG: hypothetical protein AAFV19_11685 [Pseudomonadota bacterium]